MAAEEGEQQEGVEAQNEQPCAAQHANGSTPPLAPGATAGTSTAAAALQQHGTSADGRSAASLAATGPLGSRASASGAPAAPPSRHPARPASPAPRAVSPEPSSTAAPGLRAPTPSRARPVLLQPPLHEGPLHAASAGVLVDSGSLAATPGAQTTGLRQRRMRGLLPAARSGVAGEPGGSEHAELLVSPLGEPAPPNAAAGPFEGYGSRPWAGGPAGLYSYSALLYGGGGGPSRAAAASQAAMTGGGGSPRGPRSREAGPAAGAGGGLTGDALLGRGSWGGALAAAVAGLQGQDKVQTSGGSSLGPLGSLPRRHRRTRSGAGPSGVLHQASGWALAQPSRPSSPPLPLASPRRGEGGRAQPLRRSGGGSTAEAIHVEGPARAASPPPVGVASVELLLERTFLPPSARSASAARARGPASGPSVAVVRSTTPGTGFGAAAR
jgi:hypothetical protein